jgi:hypothetical protein
LSGSGVRSRVTRWRLAGEVGPSEVRAGDFAGDRGGGVSPGGGVDGEGSDRGDGGVAGASDAGGDDGVDGSTDFDAASGDGGNAAGASATTAPTGGAGKKLGRPGDDGELMSNPTPNVTAPTANGTTIQIHRRRERTGACGAGGGTVAATGGVTSGGGSTAARSVVT